METLKEEQSLSTLQKVAAKVLHFVMGPDHPLASHGDHFVDDIPQIIEVR